MTANTVTPRSARSYSDGALTAARPAGDAQAIRVDQPVAGYYRYRLRSGGIVGVARIWYGPPHDPDTGEEMDRSWRWQAAFNGDPIDFDRVWPGCAGSPVSARDYETAHRRQDWARQHAPDSAHANPMKKRDPLSTSEPLPF